MALRLPPFQPLPPPPSDSQLLEIALSALRPTQM